MERNGRPACPYYTAESVRSARITLAEHVARCPLWHQDGAEALRVTPDIDENWPSVWRVYIELDDGDEVAATVLAKSASIATVVLGNWVRAQRGDGAAAFKTAEARALRGQAILEIDQSKFHATA